MGLIIETDDMGQFSTEIRQESFYIAADDDGTMFLYPSRGHSSGGIVEFCLEDIPKLRVCLDEIEKEYNKRLVNK